MTLAEKVRALAVRWGWDPDHLTDEQQGMIADQIRIWAQ
jgi:hypothetical protein